ncbi:hypothetical protein EDC04DRAFT_636676 [Pisolithus marmoratus]|nr:hypothetical protein EDC04DRAFT_636676 [Pisolithus marmoratus]
MLLLNVKAIVDRDTDINLRRAVPKTKVLKECDDTMTPYAILSHRWQDEVGYNEMIDLTEMEEAEREDVRRRSGYEKILRSCKQAKEDGLEWLWVDTCCIDKRSSSALSEAINSMYRWYENSTKCYAYLYDIDGPTFPIAENLERYGNHKGWPEWFSRGWTLQELIAPRDVQFFNKEWVSIGNKRELADTLEKITRISRDILISGMNSGVCSVAQIMSWAADRETTLVEDRAYSLLGLFGVHMPMVYGEGKKAFQRLQLEIIRLSNDHSIFAWDPEGRIRRSGSILADDPSYFRDCDGISSVEPNRFVQRLKSDVQHPSVAGRIMPANLITSAVLAVRRNALVRELSTCSIASGGLQISLPVVPYPGSSSRFRATLGCVASPEAPLMTIDLGFDSTRYFRFFGATEQQPTTLPRVKPLFLSYYQDESRRNLTLDDRTVSFYGFTRYGTFPRDIIGNSVKLLLKNDLIVVIYANDKADVRFAVGFGYYLGSPWTHVVYDECSGTRSWRDYAEEAYDAMWNRQPDLVSKMPVHNHKSSDTASFIKHVHLPRSIWAAKVMQGIWNQENRKVTIDVVLCSGCCHGPLAWELSTTDWNGVETPGPMRGVSPPSATYDLYMDGVRMRLLHFPNFQIKLGDYGRCNPTFEHDGNIFEGVTEDPAYDPVEHKISSDTMAGDIVTVLASGDSYSKLDLSHPAGRSLPNNQQLVSLLKTLSPRLVDNCLVTSVVYCATQLGGTYTPLCYLSIPQVWRRDAIDEKRQALFKEIREHFYTLLNWVHFYVFCLHALKCCFFSPDPQHRRATADPQCVGTSTSHAHAHNPARTVRRQQKRRSSISRICLGLSIWKVMLAR